MKVILQRDMSKLGQRGEVKEVADGYAINVLIKKGDAIQATPAELQKLKQKEDAKKYKRELATNTFVQLIDKLRKEKIIITCKKADAKGQLLAQIKEVDIADAIYKATSFSIDPKQILITSNIKSLGTHEIEIKQGVQKEKIFLEIK
jgi:large subunit ribosomal protein L9